MNKDKLLEAAQQAEINRSDREGKVLLGLPKVGDEAAYAEWLRIAMAVDGNSKVLGAPFLYGLASPGCA